MDALDRYLYVYEPQDPTDIRAELAGLSEGEILARLHDFVAAHPHSNPFLLAATVYLQWEIANNVIPTDRVTPQ